MRRIKVALPLLLAGCGVAVEDRTAAVLPRDPAGLYTLTVRVEKAGNGVGIGDVQAVTSVGTFPMAPAGGLDWSGHVPVAACVNGFDVRYEAEWTLLLAGNTEREPLAGVHQKWLSGPPPQGCGTVFGHLFVVNSTADQPDGNPGDGICSTGGFGGPCTLRAAVMEANATRGQDRIELGGQTYTLTRKGDEDKAATGDLDILDEVAIVGTGATVISAGATDDRVFDLSPTGDPFDLELHLLSVRDGKAFAGAGIRSRGRLHLIEADVRENVAAFGGGGIFNDGGFVELHDSELKGNEATGNPGAQGGGLLSAGADASIYLRASSITGNRSGQHGGGMLISEGRLEMRDGTIAENESNVHGAGLFLNGGARARLRNLTITGNIADEDRSGGGNGGGIHLGGNTADLRIANSIVAENKAVSGRDCDGQISSAGYNLFGSKDGCTNIDPTYDLAGDDVNPLDPRLSFLTGGASLSREPMADSPALGAGRPDAENDARFERCTHVDQRGTERPKGELVDGRARCDIGAVERE